MGESPRKWSGDAGCFGRGDFRPDVPVQCPRKARGCGWMGDFRAIPYHEAECRFGDAALLKDLCARMGEWEGVMQTREKDISLLKYNLNEVKNSLAEKQQEIDALNAEKEKMEDELKATKEKNKELQHRFDQKVESLAFSRKKDNTHHKSTMNEVKENLIQKTEQICDLETSTGKMKENVEEMETRTKETMAQLTLKADNLVLKNELVEKKFDQTETKMIGYKKQLQKDFLTLKSEVNNIRDTVKNAVAQLNKQYEELQLTTRDDCRSTSKQVTAMKMELNETRTYFMGSMKEAEEKIHYLSAQFTGTEKSMKDNYNSLNSKVKKEIEERDRAMKKLKDNAETSARTLEAVQENVANVENVLFADYSDGTGGVVLKWKLQNYSHHQKLGSRVCSPVFHTQLQGYRFKLFLEWSGSQKDKLDLCLMLCAGRNHDKPLERFKMAYTLEMQDNKGNVMSYAIPLRQIETYTGKCFTIQPGKSEAEYGFGCAPFLTMPELANYIVNDMLSINCRITPL